VIKTLNKSDCDFPGVGAAGGLGFAFKTFLKAKLESGFELVSKMTDLEKKIQASDIIMTGEGQLDKQSFHGKVPIEIAKLANKHQKKVIGLFGQSLIDEPLGTISGGISIGAGYPHNKIDKVVGVYKSYFTRVGSGPFPTELFDELGSQIARQGNEFGSTTGRPRRCGWFDLVAAKFTAMLNGLDEIALTLVDVLSGLSELKICTSYLLDGKELTEFPDNPEDLARVQPQYISLPVWKEDISGIKDYADLPQNARNYVEKIEALIGVPITIVSVGPERMQTIFRN
ncbi:MAG: adenylosuccinate synthetase, partial [Candidatus Cloacimonadales bacterium]